MTVLDVEYDAIILAGQTSLDNTRPAHTSRPVLIPNMKERP